MDWTPGNEMSLWCAAAAERAIAALECSLVAAAMGDHLEALTIDWRFQWRGPRTPPENILVVEIDESSRRGLKHDQQRFNLREHLSTAIRNLWESGALVVGLDIYLEDL